VPEIRRVIKPGGIFAVEIGWDQGDAVKGLFDEGGFDDVKVVLDLANRSRVVTNGPDPRAQAPDMSLLS
jgi:release factor glutamine methyltransferase